MTRILSRVVVACSLVAVALVAAPPATAQHEPVVLEGAESSEPVVPFVFEGNVRDLPPVQEWRPGDPIREIPRRFHPRPKGAPEFYTGKPQPDPLLGLQEDAPIGVDGGFGVPIQSFDGQGFTGANPPDTLGDVGLDHYIQAVNGSGTVISIYNKVTGNLDTSFALTSLGGCATGGGDPIILYDHLADRWMLSEFGPGNSLCVFISQTPDPTGAYFSYQFNTPSFPDYPKYGVWPDGYYVSANESTSSVYALDRASMLAGLPATSQRFSAPNLSGFGFQALTPGDLDGDPPPAGSPAFFMRHRDTEAHGPAGLPTTDILELWEFHVDWATPANSTFTQVPDIQVAEFDSDICGFFSFSAIAMPGVAKCAGSSLDPLREVVMFRLAYRNFGSHQTLVGNLSTDVTGNDDAGVRWFELRKVGAANWALEQEGTYAPDADSRWMGSIAMDMQGNIAVGYNVSSSVTSPSLRYVGRLAGDPLGTMPQGEHPLVAGSASNGSNRYGDYAALSVDPADDCTFWFTGEYNVASGWSTRVGAFKFASCVQGPDFTLAVTPPDLSVCSPLDAIYTVDVGSLQGFTDPVTLSVSGEPGGTTAVFNVNPVNPPGASLLTIGNTVAAAPGHYDLTVTGTASTGPKSRIVGLDVFTAAVGAPTLTSPANGAVDIDPQPTFTWQAVAQARTYMIEIATDPGFGNIVESADDLTATSYTPGTPLDSSTEYFWRVWAENGCGVGAFSATWSFTVRPAPGDCPPGIAPNTVYFDDMESGAPGWSHTGTGDTWALSGSQTISGVNAWHAEDVSSLTDQYLDSPDVVLPTGEAPLSLRYWNWQLIEAGGTGCFDGGVLELSTDGGGSWTRLESELLTDLYDGEVDSGFSSPIAGDNAWCGDPQDWFESIVDLDPWAGLTVRFRYRLATDASVGREGWYVDDVEVQSCTGSSLIFADGFESGDLSAWSGTLPP